ncbi:hypothetical protein TNCV_2112781 [Trichonephila clavipes]|nr:hypothetical protein TNCV_2112781 [Trichonephila clavipes]
MLLLYANRPKGIVFSEADSGAYGPGFQSRGRHGCFVHWSTLTFQRARFRGNPYSNLQTYATRLNVIFKSRRLVSSPHPHPLTEIQAESVLELEEIGSVIEEAPKGNYYG